jgi:hypothetical protein
VEREFWRQIVAGLSTEDAAAAAGVSKTAGERWFAEGGGMPTLELSEPSGRYLSMAEREVTCVCFVTHFRVLLANIVGVLGGLILPVFAVPGKALAA